MTKFKDPWDDNDHLFEDSGSLFYEHALRRGLSNDKPPPSFREKHSKRSRPPMKKPERKA